MKNVFYLLFILFFSAFVPIYSQVNTSLENTMNTIPLSLQDSSEQARQYLSIDAGYSFNNAVRFRNSINTLFAFNYGYQFSNIVGLEASIYYSDVMKERNNYLFTSLTGSCSIILQPFEEVPFRFGVGGAVRWYSSLEENQGFFFSIFLSSTILKLYSLAQICRQSIVFH